MQTRTYDFTPLWGFAKNIYDLSTATWQVFVEGATFSAETIKTMINKSGIAVLFNQASEFENLRKKAIETKSPILIQKIALTGGHYGVVFPDSHEELYAWIAKAENKVDGRRTYRAFHYFSNNFFFAHTDKNALQEHKILVKCLAANFPAYKQKLKELCKEILENFSVETLVTVPKNAEFKEKITLLFFHLFSSMLFGFRFTKDELAILQKSIDLLFVFNGDPLGAKTIKFSWKFHKIKSEYYQAIGKRLLAEAANLWEALKTFPQQKNLRTNYLLNTLIELIKADHPTVKNINELLKDITLEQVKIYLTHPKVLGLPLILGGLPNFINVASKIGEYLKDLLPKEPDTVAELANYFINPDAKPSESQIDFLQQLCLHALQKDTSKGILRYFKEKTSVQGITVPAHTTLHINLLPHSSSYSPETTSFPRRFPFTPFSVGARTCPAMATSMVLLKELALYLTEKMPCIQSQMDRLKESKIKEAKSSLFPRTKTIDFNLFKLSPDPLPEEDDEYPDVYEDDLNEESGMYLSKR